MRITEFMAEIVIFVLTHTELLYFCCLPTLFSPFRKR